MKKDVILNAVIYTDGSGVNQKEYGCGAHGYMYTDEDLNKKSNDRPTTHFLTNIGYVTTEDKSRSLGIDVKPCLFLDLAGSYAGDGTSNMGELLAIYETLEVIKNSEYNFKSILLISDSTYAIGATNNMIADRKDWDTPDRPNVGILRELYVITRHLITSGVTITMQKVKGHSDDIGNHTADRLAFLGRYNSHKFNKTDIKFSFRETKYWKLETVKHPLLNVKNIFFNNSKRTIYDYIIMDYPTDVELGKKTNESLYGVVIMNKPERVLEDIINHFNMNLNTLSVLSNINVKEAYSPYHIINHSTFGNDCYIFDKRKYKLNVMENLEIAKAINPPGLALQAYTKTVTLFNILESYHSDKLAKTRTIHNVTEHFFSTNEKGKTISILDSGKNILELPITIDDVKHDIVLMLGIDIISRNNLKRLEKLEPKVSIVADNISGKVIEYYIVIETIDGNAIYCNFYANKIFI